MSKTNKPYALALHGGAGAVAGRDYATVEEHLRELAGECEALLADGGSALDVVETAVSELESCGLYVAGRGSAPNTAGYVALDASIMHGPARDAGAVAALQGFVNPIRIARGVMEKTPHVLLVGKGAQRFALEQLYAEVNDPG
ncbi:MAG: isoaspartyl peptidase/L-asparaginase, partial [Gammaproteobacteria bacterium]|nr:isoaspartyl peptidase/L-asparaginase [Gammaproteobacteria bacterium]